MPPDIEQDIKEKAEKLLNRSGNTMGDALGIEFIKISRHKMSAKMPVNKNTIQPFGILHGGASVALAETLASIGAWLNVNDDSRNAVGLEINANHLRPVKAGKKVTGTAIPIHIGSKTQVWEIRIVDERDKPVCIARCTLMII
ncbi:MAG: hotdog fold thioesterase [Balneolaceae bacterium]